MNTNMTSKEAESFEPGEPRIEMDGARPEKASELTGQLLRAMGWHDFDDLLNKMEGLDKGKHIQILTTGFSS